MVQAGYEGVAMTEKKQIDIFGNEVDPVPDIKKGKKRYRPMQALYGITKGKTCKTCKHCICMYHHTRSYYKCELWIISHSSATDIRLKNNACGKYEE